MGNVVNLSLPDRWRDIKDWDERDGYVLIVDKSADSWVPVVAEYDGLNFIDPVNGWALMDEPTHWATIPSLDKH